MAAQSASAAIVATPHLSSVRHPGGSFNGSKRASLRRVVPRAATSVAFWDTESRHAHVSGTKAPNVSPEEKLVACSILTVSVLPLTSILAALWCPWKKPLMTR